MIRPVRMVALASVVGVWGGCDKASTDPAVPKAAVEKAFADANPGGRSSVELGGRNVWLEAGMFVPGCLESKDLAFNDIPAERPSGSAPRISPTYANQRYITGTSERGVCVVLGADPQATVTNVVYDGAEWVVDYTVAVSEPTPWFECLMDRIKNNQATVKIAEDGTASVQQDLTLLRGGCSLDLPKDVERRGGDRPTAKPPKPPTAEAVAALARDFDKALFEADFVAARKLVRCVNLFESPMWDACALSELIAVGPSFSGEPRGRDGTPWMEYVVRGPDEFARIVPERGDPTLFHVMMKHKRSGADRSFTVQWADGKWHLFGVVQLKAEGLTAMRFVNDLHDRKKMDILERRIKGDKIDHLGNPIEEEE